MIWLIGSKGMLGRELEEALKANKIEFTSTDKEVDITDLKSLQKFSKGRDFKLIINCAAYTAVNKAEEESTIAYNINALGPQNIAKTAKQKNIPMLHFSTDYIFDGLKKEPYLEEDIPNPKNIYGKTKLEGEILARKETDNLLILRISWLYGRFGTNFVKTMLDQFKTHEELQVVNDQYGSPTFATQLVQNLMKLIKAKDFKTGIYHYCDCGVITWFDFANEILRISSKIGLIKNKKPIIKPTLLEKFNSLPARPQYSVLDTNKSKKLLNFEIKPWKENLEYFLKSLRDPGLSV